MVSISKGSAKLGSPEQIWPAILEELALQLPQATFNMYLLDTKPQSVEDGKWWIAVTNPHTEAWLSGRLFPIIKRAFDHILAENGSPPAELQFTMSSQSLPRESHTQTNTSPSEVIYQFVDFDLFERGWLKTPHYYEIFWQAVLGYAGYAFWRYQQLVNWSRQGPYTRSRVIDLSRAAAHLGIDRKVLKGAKGGRVGGALAELTNHGVGQFQVHGNGRHTSYSGRVLRSLPLLTPTQTESLPPSLQEEHVRWLADANFDIDSWYQIQESTLAGQSENLLPSFASPDWQMLEPLGFLITPGYYDLFLQPLIGPIGYSIWRLLKCLYYAPKQRYTRERRITVDAIAQRLSCHRQAITGCMRRRNGVKYWQDGAFDQMRAEGIATIREEGQGRKRAYRIRVLNSPRLLTPFQAEKLKPPLQNAHDEWVERARLDLEAWQQLDLPNLTESNGAETDVQ